VNYVFISPNFPHTGTYFCDRLSQNGITVLGIGDTPYDALDSRLKKALTEYYYVNSLEDYSQVFRAVAYFSFMYGKIDRLESLNEYWLELDARLRTDFNIPFGTRSDRIAFIKEKALMKKIYHEAGIPTARQHVVTTREEGRAFINEVGYPVVVKPNVGVGANDTWKLTDDASFEAFYDALPSTPYVMEEFIEGDIWTYDAIIDSRCEPLFESTATYAPVMDAVLDDLDVAFYTCPEVPPQLLELGRRTVKAFGVCQCFVHLEFFKLASPRPGLGDTGDFVALEVNMRPAGGHDPDMMNYAHSVDVFKIYADMVAHDKRFTPVADEQYFCAYAARKDGHSYARSHEEIMRRYDEQIVLWEEMPPIDWPQMGRYVYMARFKTYEEVEKFFDFVVGK
jgi:hypothetical protein